MKRSKIACLLLVGGGMLAMASGLCACEEAEENFTNDQTNGGSGSTTLVTDKAPDELSAENAVYAFLQKQSELSSYKITAEGSAVASLAGYKQDIHNITFKNGDDYLNQAESNSFLVKMKHQSFSKGGKVVYRDSFDGEMKVAEKEEYKKIYGFTADDVTLGGYIVNAKTLRYANLEKTEGDTLTYYLRLAGDQSVLSGSAVESATAFTRLQAKAYGSLDNLPAFSDVDLRLTIKKDWTPVSYSSYCTYDCKKIFEMSVEQTLSCTYSDVNGTVEIPDVANFNAKLGSSPSKVEQTHPQEEPFVELLSALGNSLGEEGALDVPVSLDVTPFSFETVGALKLRLTRDALERGDFLDALSLRFDLDLSPVPLLGSFCNFLTVRYPGDGLLLLQLGSGAGEQSKILSTYTLDLENTLPAVSKDMLDLQTLKTVFETNFTIEKTDGGFTVSLKDGVIKKLNEGLGGVISSLEEKLGDTHGYIRSLLQATFTSARLDLAGGETINAVGCTLDGAPAENVTKGEKIALSLDVGLLRNSNLFNDAFKGELQIRLNPAAVWTGDFLALAQASLHLDLSAAQPILSMLGMIGSMAPLPAFVNSDLKSLDVYYPGDGVLTLALNNTAGDPVFTTDLDLKQFIPTVAAFGDMASGTQGLQGLQLPQIVFEIKENGFSLSLGEALVQTLNDAYQALVQKAVDYVTASAGSMGDLAGPMIKGWIGAQITGAGIFVGRTDEGRLTFNLNVDGIPELSDSLEPKAISLLSITLTHQGELNEEELNALFSGGATEQLKFLKLKAQDFETRLQALIDGMDVTDNGYDQYVKAVTALQTEIDAEEAGVKSLMSNKSYLETKKYGDAEYSVLLLTAKLYRERVTAFREKMQAIEATSLETDWDALNALYDKPATSSGITVPAIKESEVLEAAVGADTLQTYREKRAAHETKLANELAKNIAVATTTFKAATERAGWTDALTKIVNEFKPVYDKLPEDLKETTGYLAFVKKVYIKNVEELVNVYNGLESEVHALTARSDDVSIDEILDVMKKVAEASVWGSRYDLWTSNSGPKALPWINNLKPTDLTEEEQGKVSALTETRGSFLKGAIAKEILDSYAELIKTEVETLYSTIKDCRIVADGKADEWDFESLAEDKSDVLEKIHGLRFLICKVLTTDLFNDTLAWDEAVKQFARNDLTKYEAALMGDLATKE